MAQIRSGARVVTTEQMMGNAARAASGFASLGIGRGDTVAVYLRNDFAFLEASFAAGLVGAYPVPVNWHYTEDEARYLFENSGAKAIVIHADLIEPVRAAFPKGVPVLVVETPPEIQSAYGIAKDARAVPKGMTEWQAWLNGFPPKTDVAEGPGTIIYTSGTTGRPKGVRRQPPTPEQIAAQMAIIGRGMGFHTAKPQDIVTAIVGPMYHSAPNAYGLMAARMGANVILEPRFDPEEFLAMVEKHRVTHVHMVPIMFNRLLKLPEDVRGKYDLSSLRYIVHAAAPERIYTDTTAFEMCLKLLAARE